MKTNDPRALDLQGFLRALIYRTLLLIAGIHKESKVFYVCEIFSIYFFWTDTNIGHFSIYRQSQT